MSEISRERREQIRALDGDGNTHPLDHSLGNIHEAALALHCGGEVVISKQLAEAHGVIQKWAINASPAELLTALESAEAARDSALAEVERLKTENVKLRGALFYQHQVLYGTAFSEPILGLGHVARYAAGFIKRWHKDPNCDTEDQAVKAEACLLKMHLGLVAISNAARSAAKGGSEA